MSVSLPSNANIGHLKNNSGILLITNGAHAIKRLEAANVPGSKVEWLEALHEGPVPLTKTRQKLRRIRSRHFESLGWTSFDGAMSGFEKRERALQEPEKYNELQLWFEHDLYDQLQLIELLDYLSERPDWLGKTRLVQFDQFLGRVDLTVLSEGTQKLLPVTARQIAIARQAWSTFRQPHPQALSALLAEDTAALPFLKSAMLRLCQEFPDVGSGLGRTERQILQIVSKGERSPGDLFRESQALEAVMFMGDSSFYMIVDRLIKSAEPLLSLNRSDEFLLTSRVGYTDAFRDQRLTITEMGRKVLRGEADRLDGLLSAYWIGGCAIKDRGAPRWWEDRKTFVSEDS